MATAYGKEMWKLYQGGELRPETHLTGHVEEDTKAPDVRGVMHEIDRLVKKTRRGESTKVYFRQYKRKSVSISHPGTNCFL